MDSWLSENYLAVSVAFLISFVVFFKFYYDYLDRF